MSIAMIPDIILPFLSIPFPSFLYIVIDRKIIRKAIHPDTYPRLPTTIQTTDPNNAPITAPITPAVVLICVVTSGVCTPLIIGAAAFPVFP